MCVYIYNKYTCVYICISGLPIEIFYRNYLCADPIHLTFSAQGDQC